MEGPSQRLRLSFPPRAASIWVSTENVRTFFMKEELKAGSAYKPCSRDGEQRADKRDVPRTSETGNDIKYHWYLSFDYQKAFCTIRDLVLLPPRNGQLHLSAREASWNVREHSQHTLNTQQMLIPPSIPGIRVDWN